MKNRGVKNQLLWSPRASKLEVELVLNVHYVLKVELIPKEKSINHYVPMSK